MAYKLSVPAFRNQILERQNFVNMIELQINNQCLKIDDGFTIRIFYLKQYVVLFIVEYLR